MAFFLFMFTKKEGPAILFEKYILLSLPLDFSTKYFSTNDLFYDLTSLIPITSIFLEKFCKALSPDWQNFILWMCGGLWIIASLVTI